MSWGTLKLQRFNREWAVFCLRISEAWGNANVFDREIAFTFCWAVKVNN